MFETNVIVAPHSPSPRANDKTLAANIPGVISGIVIVRKARKRDGPSVLAAASSRHSTVSKDKRIDLTMSGNAIKVAVIAAPVQLKGNKMQNVSYIQPPIGPERPNTISNRYPTTTGGTTNGRCSRASTTAFAGNSKRAISQTDATPNGRLAITFVTDTYKLNGRAASSNSDSPRIGR